MVIDWTINAGNMMVAVGLASAFFWGGARLYSRLVAIEHAISQHAGKLETLDDRVMELVRDFAGILGALNPSTWVKQPAAHSNPSRLP